MSNLRIIGLILGILGLSLTFRFYRGERWNRVNFLLFLTFSVFLIAVSLDPNLVNVVRGMFAMQSEYRGRLLAPLILSNIILWFLLLYFKFRLDEHRYQFDLLVRNLGHEEEKDALAKDLSGKEIMIVIPAYNEEENLKAILPKIPKNIKGKETGVLVVDDGSQDNTASVVWQLGCLLVRNRINRGQGAASRLGYDVLLKHNIKVGVTMDADGQHSPEEIELLVRPILEDKYDLVIGSRTLGKAEKNKVLRKIGISFFTKVINMLAGSKLTDCSSGFKAFNTEKMKKRELNRVY